MTENKIEESLYKNFHPEKYELNIATGQVKIIGKKVGPPSKRITLHQKGLKIIDAQIIRHDKKGGQKFVVARINHLPTFEQVRLHTKETLFPGNYELIVEFSPRLTKIAGPPDRQSFPCIDEPAAWGTAELVNLH